MTPNLDIDILKTFLAIADAGSFTRAAAEVHKTQGAVSMQMKRLEEMLGRPIFARDGRQNRLTQDGRRLLDYAQRIAKLNDEAVTTFIRPDLTGIVRFGTPDDYAERLLPDILARFSRTHPLVRVDVESAGSRVLIEQTRRGEHDLALVTCECCEESYEVVHSETLVWVSSLRHNTHLEEPLPIAFSHHGCPWREMAVEAIERRGLPYRIAYVTANSAAVAAVVLSGLAVGAVPAILVKPGMRILGGDDGFPPIGDFNIGLARAPGKPSSATDALARHIADSLQALRQPMLAAAE